MNWIQTTSFCELCFTAILKDNETYWLWSFWVRIKSWPWYNWKFHCNVICSLFGERLWALLHWQKQVPAPFPNNVKPLEILHYGRGDSDSLNLFNRLIFSHLCCFYPPTSSADPSKGRKSPPHFKTQVRSRPNQCHILAFKEDHGISLWNICNPEMCIAW